MYKEFCHLKDLGVYGMIILKWALKTWDGKAGTGFLCLRIGTDDRL